MNDRETVGGAAHGADAARAAGDYLFARAFAELAATGDARAVSLLAGAALSLARGEAPGSARPSTGAHASSCAAPVSTTWWRR